VKGLWDVLLALIISAVSIAVYHAWVVMPMMESRPRIYTVNVDALIEKARQQAVNAILEGKRVDPDTITAAIRMDLARRLKRLPPDVMVLDSSAVLRGRRNLDANR